MKHPSCATHSWHIYTQATSSKHNTDASRQEGLSLIFNKVWCIFSKAVDVIYLPDENVCFQIACRLNWRLSTTRRRNIHQSIWLVILVYSRHLMDDYIKNAISKNVLTHLEENYCKYSCLEFQISSIFFLCLV